MVFYLSSEFTAWQVDESRYGGPPTHHLWVQTSLSDVILVLFISFSTFGILGWYPASVGWLEVIPSCARTPDVVPIFSAVMSQVLYFLHDHLMWAAVAAQHKRYRLWQSIAYNPLNLTSEVSLWLSAPVGGGITVFAGFLLVLSKFAIVRGLV